MTVVISRILYNQFNEYLSLIHQHYITLNNTEPTKLPAYYGLLMVNIQILQLIIDNPSIKPYFTRVNEARNGLVHGFKVLTPAILYQICKDLFTGEPTLKAHLDSDASIIRPFKFTRSQAYRTLMPYAHTETRNSNLNLGDCLLSMQESANSMIQTRLPVASGRMPGARPPEVSEIASLCGSLLVFHEALSRYLELEKTHGYSYLVFDHQFPAEAMSKNRNQFAHSPSSQRDLDILLVRSNLIIRVRDRIRDALHRLNTNAPIGVINHNSRFR